MLLICFLVGVVVGFVSRWPPPSDRLELPRTRSARLGGEP
jgi:hypothetical protein